ncbi:NAD-dependent epimerase/dehydratase family protein [Salinicola halophyticus]|uniref:NAD-dependent epimerase/dehydratase family protein n=1 Tax=Salinicola halophyticus TaxID=1808881 RepID=UPI003F47C10A
MKLLLAGVTGLVGSHLLTLALRDTRVDSVIALARSPVPANPKLRVIQTDFERLESATLDEHIDAAICVLGTTLRAAGSRQAFYRVDHDYPLHIATLARKQLANTFVLTSAIGANADSRFFYNRVKGELERDLQDIGFESLTFVRPTVIHGDRREIRTGERLMIMALQHLRPVLPARWQLNPAECIASTLLEAALGGKFGTHIINAEHLH